MKIGYDYVQPSVTPAGCGWYAHSLFVEMARRAPQHQFLAYRHFGGIFVPDEKLVPLPALPNVVNPLPGQPQRTTRKAWRKHLAQGRAPGAPDIVHSLSFQAPQFTSAKLVITIFDVSFWAHPEYTTDATRLGCQRGVLDSLDYADGLIFISEHSRREFDRYLPRYARRDKIPTIVTPLACRYAPISEEQAERNIAHDGDYWLFVGSLEPRKNLVALLEAYEAYAHAHPAPKPLCFVGGSGWKNEQIKAKLRPLEERGLARHLGFVSDEELPKIYQRAAAFIFPSWYEGFGLPILEAMSQGCPVISSDRSSLPEVGGSAALYIDPAAPQTITAAMHRIESEAELREGLIREGLIQVAKFSWEKTAQQTLAFYEEVLKAPFTRTTELTKIRKEPRFCLRNTLKRSLRQAWDKCFPTRSRLEAQTAQLNAQIVALRQTLEDLQNGLSRVESHSETLAQKTQIQLSKVEAELAESSLKLAAYAATPPFATSGLENHHPTRTHPQPAVTPSLITLGALHKAIEAMDYIPADTFCTALEMGL